MKQCLEDQELYSHSLEHDVDQHVLELEKELKLERKLRKKLQRENDEFQRFLLCDKKRGGDLEDFKGLCLMQRAWFFCFSVCA